MLKLAGKNFEAAVIKMLQLSITNMPETSKTVKTLAKK